MQVFLIKELDKRKLFGKVMLKNDQILIKQKVDKMKISKKVKIVNGINKILKNNNSNKGIDIIQGRYLFKVIIEDFLENICIQNNIKEKDSLISITVNDVDKWVIKLIENLSKKFKMVNIVTTKSDYFKNLQKMLYDENGIIITITNNKKRALSKANIILNIDYPEEMINKYVIKDDAIIINLEEKIKIKKKRFNGKIINDYEIKVKENTDMVEIYIINNPNEIENVIISK